LMLTIFIDDLSTSAIADLLGCCHLLGMLPLSVVNVTN
jgi:hypothetical protein